MTGYEQVMGIHDKAWKMNESGELFACDRKSDRPRVYRSNVQAVFTRCESR